MYHSNIKGLAVLMAFAAIDLSLSAETTVKALTDHSALVTFDSGQTMTVDFYGPNVFRLFQDPEGGPVRNPQATPPAQILVDNPRVSPGTMTVTPSGQTVSVATGQVRIDFDKSSSKFTVTDLRTNRPVVETVEEIAFTPERTTVTLAEAPTEYFYGGGVQNGRFSHKGKVIDIRNTNSWTDGGVSSPTPFYWSTGGYGAMWHTFRPGAYDFGSGEAGKVVLSHDAPYLDLFLMVDSTPVALLNDFYQLTGHPVLLPKFGFYEGHLNAYNRDYWSETTDSVRGILFEDGKRYRESQKDNGGGIRETLNGEVPGDYQFSARAVIDRYAAADMPLGWILPNDGYGCGYGHTSTLEGNVQNLKEFGEYARAHGVEIGLWTQSDLYPVDGIEPLLQRDIVAEVRDAGVRVLKTDVAWVGAGYSFGLNGVADVGVIMPEYGNDARPFIISVDGWAGTQRYAGIWTGDQTGGDWEYIRFHIPTYIGSGLSGQPNITSDTDGIFGGRNTAVNVRDFQWKTFSPMELNMDGWGTNPKYPQAVGLFGTQTDVETIRRFLKLKSELMPYAYTAAREAVDGKPMIRAMFLDHPNDYTHGSATKYQYMYGPSLLVAPIYKEGDVRNDIYLPEGTWFGYFDGKKYDGGVVFNNYPLEMAHIPVFVKADAIIPMNNPHNNPSEVNKALRIYELWPQGEGEYTEYDDDGTTQAYLKGEGVTTRVTSCVSAKHVLTVTVEPSRGTFAGYDPMKATEFRINISAAPKGLSVKVGGKNVKLRKVNSAEEFAATTAAYYITPSKLWVKTGTTDVSKNAVTLTVKGFELNPSTLLTPNSSLPKAPALAEADVQPYDITLRWTPAADADTYEIEHNGMLYTNLRDSHTFEDLAPRTEYSFKLRARNSQGVSEWVPVTYTTLDNPLEFAISGISATATIPSQPGLGLNRLFDFEERSDIWHSDYGQRNATPFDVTIDLGSFNTLDHFDYLPRLDAGNGTLMRGTVSYSENGTDWSEPVEFNWQRSMDTKTFEFPTHPLARYIRLHVDESLGGFGSGRELYVFKVPGTPSYLPGDINNDGKIDDNDLTSYLNYNGLRRGDGDFDYVSMGDVNRNGIIDVYDISVAATQLNGGVKSKVEPLQGSISTNFDSRKTYAPGEIIAIPVTGHDLQGLNAFGFAMPYDPAEVEFVGIDVAEAAQSMQNLTNDRLHTAGDKVLYPTFVTLGDTPAVSGSPELITIKFRARKRTKAPRATDFILVDKGLNM